MAVGLKSTCYRRRKKAQCNHLEAPKWWGLRRRRRRFFFKVTKRGEKLEKIPANESGVVCSGGDHHLCIREEG